MSSRWFGPGPVILDLQALQSLQHRDRGIGRWCREFVRALVDTRSDLVGSVFFNPDLPWPEVQDLDLKGRASFTEPGHFGVCSVYHVLSPFELDQPMERVWPEKASEVHARLVVTLFDLIPQVFASRYLADAGTRRRYRTRLELIRAADRVLTISAATRDEAVARLGLDQAKVVDVGTGVSPEFRPALDRHEALAAARRGMPGLEDRYLFAVGGEDERKNVEGLMEAFALLPATLSAELQLVAAFAMTDGYRRHLQRRAFQLGIAARVLLPGRIDDPTLVAAYQAAELFVFPSLAEGFGLPAAEALACGTPVVASRSAASAIDGEATALFDPTNPNDMAACIERALTDPAIRAALARASGRPAPRWADTAAKAVAVYEELVQERRGSLRPRGLLPKPPQPASRRLPPIRRPSRRRRLRVGFVTPLPPQPSGVAAYSYRLLEALAAHCEVDALVDALEGGVLSLPTAPLAPPGIPVHPVEHVARVEAARGGYDVLVYAIGNSEFHTGALGLARRRPGVVLAHDVRLPQLYAFAAHHGALAPDTFAGVHRKLHPRAPAPPDPLLVNPVSLHALPEPMVGELVATSLAFLTTSRFAAELAAADATPENAAKIGVLRHALRLLPPRAEPGGGPVVASFGVVNPTKSTTTLLEAFAVVAGQRPDARLVLVGPGSPGDLATVAKQARRLGIGELVSTTGRVDDAAWDRHLATTTVAVQLRASTNGEFSGAVAEALAAGVPTIVTALGAAAELPDAAAHKLEPTDSAEDLARAILGLLGDPARRQALAEGARAYAAATSFPTIAEQLFGWLDRCGAPRP